MKLKSFYRAARNSGLRASVAIAAARRHIAGPLADYHANLAAWKAEPDKRRYAPGGIANRPKYPSFYATAPDPLPIRQAEKPDWLHHDGWYTDDELHNLYAPRVWALPHGRFLAGYVGSFCEALRVDTAVYGDADQAWRVADSMAQQDAETEREYQERWSEASNADGERREARAALQDARLVAGNIIHAWRAQAAAGPITPEVCELLRLRLEDARADMRDAIEAIREASDKIEDLDMAEDFA